MSLTETILILTLAFSLLVFIQYKRTQGFKRFKLPPGPPAQSLIGNLLHFDLREMGIKFTEYKSIYGDLVFFHGLGRSILVLNSLEVIQELLENRPLTYSDCPPLIVASELVGLTQSTSVVRYGEGWGEHRPMSYIVLNPTETEVYHVSAILNLALLDYPEDFIAHVKLTGPRFALSVIYGMSVNEAGLDFVNHAEETTTLLRTITAAGVNFVACLPILKYLPSCFVPHQPVSRCRAMIDYFLTMPFEYVKQSMEKGTAPPSLVKDLLLQENGDNSAMYEDRVKWVAGTNYSAISETIYTVVLTFFLAMALHPDKQKRAQEELDHVIGTDRVPTMMDQVSCIYVSALIREVMRWYPTWSLGVLRCTSKDDEHRGYFIPKGTIVVPNPWAVPAEPDEKYDPRSFIPERFLDPDSAKEPSGIFGHGQRTYPGKAVAETSLAVLIPTILSTFDIMPPQDGALEAKYGSDLYNCPKPFRCRIIPRSSRAADLVRRAALANA